MRSLARRHTLTFHDSLDKSAACLSQSSNHASNSEATSGEQSKDQRPFLESCVAPVMACIAASLSGAKQAVGINVELERWHFQSLSQTDHESLRDIEGGCSRWIPIT